jgi:exodeoxyribonuclease VII large subunit
LNDKRVPRTALTDLFQAAPKRPPKTPAAPSTDVDAALTVSQVVERGKQTLEGLGELRVLGEVSKLSVKSGHWYLDLKDGKSVMSVVSYFRDNQRFGFVPEAGETVVVTGQLTIYPGFGRFQMMARRIEPVGEGAHKRALEALKKKLQGEGLFDVERKRALPSVPRAIGLVTSLQGAAIGDVLRVLSARFPRMPIVVSPTRVQGEGAAAEIADAIRRLDAANICDVMLVVRGGGAAEDLRAFDSEAVARAVFHARVPVVSGVGHEMDMTLCDLVADTRAATPSQAAELATPVPEAALFAACDAMQERLKRAAERAVLQKNAALSSLERRLPDMRALMEPRRRKVDAMERVLLQQSPEQQLVQKRSDVDRWTSRLAEATPAVRLQRAGARIDATSQRLDAALQRTHDVAVDRVASGAAKLHALSPLAVLSRGYAFVTTPAQTVVTLAAQTRVGDALHLRFTDGSIDVDVSSTARR